MQIEEAFRDQKSQTYGLGSNAHRTKKKGRLAVLLLWRPWRFWGSVSLKTLSLIVPQSPPLHFNHVVIQLRIPDALDPIPPSRISLNLLWQIVAMVICPSINANVATFDFWQSRLL
ncbi:hypothetical protein [Rheinheimera sp. F8]|uniref:hypothetical protein n=1 Tax=Rheinheimera sp. F8 TaxID=1763998 RepID=UPI000ACB86A1|nr:hypothetical protein [Rheinheimera sp. F8]